jgi:hypothetical protein
VVTMGLDILSLLVWLFRNQARVRASGTVNDNALSYYQHHGREYTIPFCL